MSELRNFETIFGAGGLLSEKIPDWRVRPQQIDMARRVAQAIQDCGRLVCEAGTGTGKTFAYLVPALLSGGKVIISTGTKTLQDQLYRRDLPVARSSLGVPVSTALLKGRANYVCQHHLEHNLRQASLASREDAAHLRAIERFARTTQRGDRAELGDVPEDAPAWALATSTRENCLGQRCDHYDRCFVLLARREALAADVVVVNHHLFFADVMLKDEGMAELLPACNTVILDEAHQLPQTATLFFGESVSTGQVVELARDTRVEKAINARDVPVLERLASALEKSSRDLRLALSREGARIAAASLAGDRKFQLALEGVESALAELGRALAAVAERAEELGRLGERCAELLERVGRWRSLEDDDSVRWVETFSHSLQLHSTPLSVAEVFRRQIEGRPKAWIFTSATLAVSGDFSHYCHELGLDGARCAAWESPFDYAGHAMLYIPRGLPQPNTAEHTEAVVKAALPVIRASAGRAFLLFTSLRGMRLAHQLLADSFARGRIEFPLLLQGEGSRTELLERFRRLGNAVLVGSSTFWEGVDVRGEALSLVVIDKLPFAPPDDPVLRARLNRLERDGRNPFLEYQLPQAVISLKQGAGRLIRDENDRGVLMICDHRLLSKPYGKVILPSLPPMRFAQDLREVERFLRSLHPSAV